MGAVSVSQRQRPPATPPGPVAVRITTRSTWIRLTRTSSNIDATQEGH